MPVRTRGCEYQSADILSLHVLQQVIMNHSRTSDNLKIWCVMQPTLSVEHVPREDRLLGFFSSVGSEYYYACLFFVFFISSGQSRGI